MNLIYCSPRQKELLQIVLSTHSWLTGEILSAKLKVSDRTIRNDIAVLNYALESYNASIMSERGKGYKLQTHNREFLTSVLFKYTNSDYKKENRFQEIVLSLLFSKNGMELFDLEEKLHISRSTLEKELRSIKKYLNNLYPKLKLIRENNIISICGKEISIRFLLNDIFIAHYDDNNHTFSFHESVYDQKHFNKIYKEVIEIAGRNSLAINDQALLHISVFLFIAYQRINLGFTLSCSSGAEITGEENLIDKISIDLFNKVLKQEKMPEKVRTAELEQIAVQLSFVNLCQTFEADKDELLSQTSDQILIIVNSLISNIRDDFEIDLTHDEELFWGLVFHVKALINRVKYKRQAVNSPILEVIKKQYPFIFELSFHIYNIFQDVLGISLTESELSYIAVHIAAGIERIGIHHGKDQIKIAVVSQYASSYAQLLVSNVKSIASSAAQVLGPYPVYKIDEVIKMAPSIILLTCQVPAEKIPNGIIILKTDLALTKELQSTLLHHLNDLRNKLLFKTTPKDNLLTSKFSEKLFYANLDLNTPEEVMDLMANAMEMEGIVPEDFYERLLAREKISSTVLENGIAAPHALKACALKTMIGVVTLKKPIKWKGHKVRLVFVLALKKEELSCLREVFEFIGSLMDNDKMVSKLLEAREFNTFLDEVGNILY